MNKSVWAGIVVVLVLVFGALYVFKSSDSSKTSESVTGEAVQSMPASISGKVLFTGLKPKSDAEGKVVLTVRKAGETEFKKIKDLPLVDLESWTWTGAEADVNYDLQAYVDIQGQKVDFSDILAVTAPAVDENLILDVSADELPVDIREKGVREAQSARVVSGTLALQGYVPVGSTLRVSSKLATADDSAYRVVTSGLAARDGVTWSWSEGMAGTKYKYHAELLDKKGTVVGASDHVVVSTPADNQKITVVSTVTAPVVVSDTDKAVHVAHVAQSNHQSGTISGTVSLNGSIKDETTFVVQYRKAGEKEFHAVQTVSAKDGAKWEWSTAQDGVNYEVRALLERKHKEIAHSRTQSVTAPAKNIHLKINSGLSFDSPSSLPKVASCDKDGKNYSLKVTFPSVEKANMYWVQVGTRHGSSNIYDEKIPAVKNNKDVSVKVKVTNDDTNHVRYGYAYCEDCSDDQNYSDFSDSVSFQCGK